MLCFLELIAIACDTNNEQFTSLYTRASKVLREAFFTFEELVNILISTRIGIHCSSRIFSSPLGFCCCCCWCFRSCCSRKLEAHTDSVWMSHRRCAQAQAGKIHLLPAARKWAWLQKRKTSFSLDCSQLESREPARMTHRP